MRVRSAALLVAALMLSASAPLAHAQAPVQTPGAPQTPPSTTQPPPVQTQGTQTPAAPPATVPPGQTPAPAAPPVVGVPTTPVAGPSRAFSAPVGLLFNTVRPERVADFEKVIAYLQHALEISSDPMVQAQARGWRMYKATEPGPNGTVLYVFAMDPTVPGAEYGLGRILAAAYPNAAELQEIWRLYTTSVTSGGSLLNLTPVMPPLPEPPGTPASTSPTPNKMLPPDANPNQPGR
jgi:hypothetical protein